MDKKTIILIALVSILILASVGGLIFVLINKNSGGFGGGGPEITGEFKEPVLVPLEEAEKQVNKDFPDTLTGTLEFGANEKATLKTSTKTYTFTPNQPKGIYESFGVKSGEKIEIRAKISQDNTINWALMKPAK